MSLLDALRRQSRPKLLTLVAACLFSIYFATVLLVSCLLHKYPFDTPSSAWLLADCDHLAWQMNRIGDSRTLPEFHADCLAFARKTLPICAASSPDGRFSEWRHTNATLALDKRYSFLKALTVADLSVDVQTDTQSRLDVCYLGRFDELIDALEKRYEIDSHRSVRELHTQVPHVRPARAPASALMPEESPEPEKHLHPPLRAQEGPGDAKLVHVVYHYVLADEVQTRDRHQMDALFWSAVAMLAVALLVTAFERASKEMRRAGDFKKTDDRGAYARANKFEYEADKP